MKAKNRNKIIVLMERLLDDKPVYAIDKSRSFYNGIRATITKPSYFAGSMTMLWKEPTYGTIVKPKDKEAFSIDGCSPEEDAKMRHSWVVIPTLINVFGEALELLDEETLDTKNGIIKVKDKKLLREILREFKLKY